jgi:hypothetical protein
VGRNVQVSLSQTRGSGDEGPTLTTALTNDLGQYQLNMPSGGSESTCPRFIVSVGSGTTLTRGLVFGSGSSQPIDISYASEAALRLFYQRVAKGADLCDLINSDVPGIVNAIGQLPVTGSNAFEINNDAFVLANSDPAIQAMVNVAFGASRPTRRATRPRIPFRVQATRPR